MRKNVLFTITAIAILAVGFVAGMLIQRQFQLAPVQFAADIVRDLAGTDELIPAAPTWDDWKYPGADSKAKTGGVSLRLMDKLVLPAGQYGIWVTHDSYQDVVRFYAQKAHFKNPDSIAENGGVGNEFSAGTGDQPWLNAHLSNTRDRENSDAGALGVQCLIRRGRSYDITVFITRDASEDDTHIIVVYDPKTKSKEQNE